MQTFAQTFARTCIAAGHKPACDATEFATTQIKHIAQETAS
jgi:hypothetical protein